MKKTRTVKISKTPPPGWPTKSEWIEIEKTLEKSKAIQIISSQTSPVDRAKHELCAHFVRYCQEKKITQRELAKILCVSESRVSEIVHYRHGRFTIDKMLELLNIIKPKLKFKVA